MSSVDRDRFLNAHAGAVAIATMALVDRLQTQPGELQVHAAAALFILISEQSRLSPQDIFTATKNLMVSPEGTRTSQFEAIKMYLANEYAGRPLT